MSDCWIAHSTMPCVRSAPVRLAPVPRRPRDVPSPSALAARALYISIYRRRWGCEAALQGARLRLARSYLVGSQAQAGGAAFGDSADAFGAGFDPSREADVAAAGAPTLGGVPAGQRG